MTSEPGSSRVSGMSLAGAAGWPGGVRRVGGASPGTSAPSLGRVAAASPRVRCRALFTCLDFERADLDQVDSVARIDESSAFGLTVITMSGVTSRGASMRRRLPASASSPVPVSFAPASTTAATATDGGVSAQETADRAAVEAQWIRSWDAYAALAHTPGDQRAALAGTAAVDPALTNMLTDAQTLTGKGWDTYGQIAHRISWPQSVDGKPSAVIADCQDSSQSGSYETSTGYKRTVGVPRDHMQGLLLRSDDGVWRVQQVFYLKGCLLYTSPSPRDRTRSRMPS